jgi:hypothetical protein
VRGTHRHHPAVAKMLRWLAFGVPADSLPRRYARNLHAAWDTAVAYRLEDSVDSGSPDAPARTAMCRPERPQRTGMKRGLEDLKKQRRLWPSKMPSPGQRCSVNLTMSSTYCDLTHREGGGLWAPSGRRWPLRDNRKEFNQRTIGATVCARPCGEL